MAPTVLHPRNSFAEQLAAYFQARPNLWIDGLVLARVAGAYGWRGRISDVRRPPYSLRIENRQRRVRNAHGRPSTVSEYRNVVDRPAATAIATAADDWTLMS